MSENFEFRFYWPHTEPNTVIVAGTFDQWSQSIHLVKGEDGFRGKALVSWNAKILYKFIVDGQWVVNTQEPTETDEAGNVNNVFTTPSKPSDVSQANGNGTVPESQPASDSAADLVTTIAATDGTSSALNYVASGVGAAIQGVIGVDPINPDQMSVKSPISPVPPTPSAIAPLIEESIPDSAVSESAAEEKSIAELPTSDTTESAAAPAIEPSTHTPVTPAVESLEEPSTAKSSPAAEVSSEPAVEASTHILIPTPVKSESSIDVVPDTSATDVITSESASSPAAEAPSEPAVEASTHILIPTSVKSESSVDIAPDASAADVVITESASSPAVEATPENTKAVESVPPSAAVEISSETTAEPSGTRETVQPAPEASSNANAAEPKAPVLTAEATKFNGTNSVESPVIAEPVTEALKANADSTSKTEDAVPAATSTSAGQTTSTEAPKTNGESVSKAEDVVPTVTSVPAEPITSTPAVEAPKANGDSASKSKDAPATPPETPSAPSTPSKKDSQAFPTTDSASSSPSSSKFGTASSRTKRKSIFGRMSLKNIFSKDKDKEKEKS